MENKKILTKILIPSNSQTYNFEISSYKEEYLKDIMNKEKYEDILKNANKLLYKCIVKKKKNDMIDFPILMKIFSIFSVILGIIYVIVLFLKTTNTSTDQGNLFLFFQFISSYGAVSIISILSIVNFFRPNRKFKSLEQFFDEDLKGYFMSVNEQFNNLIQFIYIEDKKTLDLLIFKSGEDVNSQSNNEDNEEKNSYVGEGLNSSHRSGSKLLTPNKENKKQEIEMRNLVKEN